MTTFIRKYRIAIIILTFVLAGLATLLLPHLEFEFDLDKFMPKENKEAIYLKAHERVFGSLNSYLTIAIVREEGVLDTAFLSKVKRFTEACSELDIVEEAISLPTLRQYVRTPFSWIKPALVHYENDSIWRETKREILENENLVNNFISADTTTLNVLLKVSKILNLEEKVAYISGVDSLIAAFDFEETHLAGMTFIEMRFTELATQEFGKFLGLCVLIIFLTLGFIYRSFWGVALPMLVFILTAIFILALFVVAGWQFNTLTNSLFSIILIVAVSDVIHIFSKFHIEDYAHEKVDLSAVIVNNGLTSVTTFIGFITFYWTPMEAMQYYGVEAAFCVLFAYIISIFFVPAVLFCLKPKHIPQVSTTAQKIWQGFYHFIEKINGISIKEKKDTPLSVNETPIDSKKRNNVFIGLASLIALSLLGISWIDTNPTLTSPMSENHPVRVGNRVLEEKKLGNRYFELSITAQKGKITDLENLKMLEKIHDYLFQTEEIHALVSPVTYIKSAHRARSYNREEAYRLPNNQNEIKIIERSIPKDFKETFSTVLDSSRTRGMFMGRMTDAGKNVTRRFNEKVMQDIVRLADTTALKFKITGTALMVDRNNDIQIKNTLQGLGIAVVVIALIMALLFRNIRFVVITLLVNMIPLVLMAGLMGFAGYEMRSGTAVVFTIAFVIAVDDTIHFLSSYNYHLRKIKNTQLALFQTIRTTGKALFFTSLVIFFSFGILLFSAFGDMSALGFLVGSSIIFALVLDLGVLPWLIKRY